MVLASYNFEDDLGKKQGFSNLRNHPEQNDKYSIHNLQILHMQSKTENVHFDSSINETTK